MDIPASEWTDNGLVVQYLKVCDVTDTMPPVAPEGLTINDPSDTIDVDFETATYDVVGMAGDDIEGDVTWTNAATGAHGTFNKSVVWTQSVDLVVGENVITVSAKSKAGGSFEVLASENGTNSVAGFGDFVNSTEGTGGLFVHDNVSATDISGFENNHAFGLWANSGSAAVFTRAIDADGEVLSVGVTLGMRYNNQDGVDTNDKGVQFIDADGKAIFGVKQGDGQAVRYWYSGGDGTWSTSMGGTSAAFDVVLTKTANGYAVSGTKRDGGQFAGLNIETTAKIAGFKFWMNGVPDDQYKDFRQLYFNNLRYTVASGTGEIVSDSVKIVVAEAAKDPPVFTVGEIPTNAVPGQIVTVTVTAAGEGNPTVAMTGATLDGKKYGGAVTYAAGSGLLSFTPTLGGQYKFDFVATNTSSDKNAASTNVVVVVKSTKVSAQIQGMSIADGKLSVTLDPAVFSQGTSVPVWISEGYDTAAGTWNWQESDPAIVGEGGLLDLNLDLTSKLLVISIGKPGDQP